MKNNKSSYKLVFNQERLHTDLLIRLKMLDMNQRQIKPICRATLLRMSKGKPITMATMLKCVEWLGHDPNRYIYYEKINKKAFSAIT